MSECAEFLDSPEGSYTWIVNLTIRTKAFTRLAEHIGLTLLGFGEQEFMLCFCSFEVITVATVYV